MASTSTLFSSSSVTNVATPTTLPPPSDSSPSKFLLIGVGLLSGGLLILILYALYRIYSRRNPHPPPPTLPLSRRHKPRNGPPRQPSTNFSDVSSDPGWCPDPNAPTYPVSLLSKCH
ncbi:hypothetical protein HDU96_000754, partial [Phlyctochytrium bullatum]